MDKLIPVFNFLKNNRFWIACGFLSIAMIATWFISTNQLIEDKSSWESDLKSKINSANAIIKTTAAEVGDNVVAHPNETTIAGMNAEIQEGIDAVLAAWKLRREKQESILVWPKEVIDSDDFVRVFKRFDPPETFPVETDPNTMLELLAIYKQQIPPRMEQISNIIGTKWKHGKKKSEKDKADSDEDERPPANIGPGGRERERGGAGRPSVGAQKDKTGIDISTVVQWNEENQDLWNDKLTTFRGYDDNQLTRNYPTPLQIFMLQQDLWLLEAMFNVIKEVNGDANANDLAPIKVIDHIAFGREARAQLGELTKPNARLAGSTKAPAKTNAKRDRSAGGRGRARKETKDPFATNTDKYKSPFHGRYVDADYEPITAEDVRQVLATDRSDLPDKYLELIVAKRIPVRIALQMDERKIPEFISKAANYPFAFEINQVRINKHVPNEGIVLVGAMGKGGARGEDEQGSDRGSTIGAAGGAGGTGMAGGESEFAPGSRQGEEAATEAIETRTSYDVAVEFYGIVKIYNPVNRALLTGEKPEVTPSAPSTKP